MENRINQVVKLDNGNNYVIIKQAIYKNDSYFLVSKLDSMNNPMPDELVFFHQVDLNGQLKLEEVTDLNLIQYLYQYMKI